MKNKFIEPEIEVLKFQCDGLQSADDVKDGEGNSGDVDLDTILV